MNVLLLSVDTLRRDFLGCYDDPMLFDTAEDPRQQSDLAGAGHDAEAGFATGCKLLSTGAV